MGGSALRALTTTWWTKWMTEDRVGWLLTALCEGKKIKQSHRQRQVAGKGCSEEVVIQGNSMYKGPGVGTHSAPWSGIEEAGVAGAG